MKTIVFVILMLVVVFLSAMAGYLYQLKSNSNLFEFMTVCDLPLEDGSIVEVDCVKPEGVEGWKKATMTL